MAQNTRRAGSGGSNTFLMIAGAGFLAALAYVFVAPYAEETPDQAPVAAAEEPTPPLAAARRAVADATIPAVPKPAAKGDLPPLPLVDYPTPRPPDVVRAVYEFAARHPEVLQYVPCYCGCERDGHRGNDDCFVKSRDAEGRVTWDAHGMG